MLSARETSECVRGIPRLENYRDRGGGEITRQTNEVLRARNETWREFLVLLAAQKYKDLVLWKRTTISGN